MTLHALRQILPAEFLFGAFSMCLIMFGIDASLADDRAKKAKAYAFLAIIITMVLLYAGTAPPDDPGHSCSPIDGC